MISRNSRPSWCRGVVRKVETILRAIRENWGRVFIWSDVDVQFFGPIGAWAEAATRELDIVFQVDAPGPALWDPLPPADVRQDALSIISVGWSLVST